MRETATYVRTDIVIVLVLWMGAYATGSWYIGVFNATGAPVDNSQHEFGAAVARACGRGFIDPGYDSAPGLLAFLNHQADRFSCDQLPRDLPQRPPNFTQRLYRYLMEATAIVWSARGRVSWSGLAPLYGALYASTIAAAYGLFRVAMRSRLLATLASIALTASAIHLSYLAYIREYAKAPFILALLLIMGRMAVRQPTRRGTLAYAIAFGVVLGIGFGFRNDLLINVPPFLMVVFCCLPGSIGQHLRLKSAAVGLAAAAFVVTAWPVLRAYQSGSNTGHVALLGLMTTFDTPLGIRGSIYDWGYTYLDGFVATTLSSYSYRVYGHAPAFVSKEYDQAAVAYFMQIARHWPADMLVRAYASVLKVLEMPFTIGAYTNPIPYGASGPLVDTVYRWQMWTLRWFSGFGAIATAMALTIAGASSISTAVALLALLLYYAGYPAIQFHVRHFFHLEFIAWLAVGFVVERTAVLSWEYGKAWSFGRAARLNAWRTAAIRAAAFVTAAAVVIVGGLKVLRAYQQPHVRSMLETYDSAPIETLRTDAIVDGRMALVRVPDLWDDRQREALVTPVSTRYLVAEFSGAACDAVRLPIALKYSASDPSTDFSRETAVTLQSGLPATRLFFPAYYNQEWSHFEGIELPRGFVRCLTSVSRVVDMSPYPLLLDIAFAPDWKQRPLFQTLEAIEAAGPSGPVSYFTLPKDLTIARAALDRVDSFGSRDVVQSAPFARAEPSGAWSIAGRPAAATSYLLRFADHSVKAGAVLLVSGQSRSGGLVVGILDGEQWSGHVAVTDPGPFVVAVEAPRDGTFGALLTTDLQANWIASHIGRRTGPFLRWLPGTTRWADVTLTKIGWVNP